MNDPAPSVVPPAASPAPPIPPPPDRASWRYLAIVGILLLLGAAVRVWGAWCYRAISDPDTGIVALMAKHVAEGGTWPVFFYGQAYMGSLEPLISAACCRLLGTSGFAVNLGTALVGVLVLGALFGWARSVGGRVTALTALVVCLVGPHRYFAFQINPRGGYMTTLLFGILTMWLGGLVAERLQRRAPVPAAAFLLLGVVAGLAWWTNPLTLAALLATALTLLIATRGRLPLAGLPAGLAGFLIGSLPFWLYNLEHAWASLAMFRDTEALHWREGLRHLIRRYMQLMEGTQAGPLDWPARILPPALALGGVAAALLDQRRRGVVNPHLRIVLFFLLFSALLFIRSKFASLNTARYLIPWLPALAILMGLAVRAIQRRAGWPVAALALGVLLIFHMDALRGVAAQGRHAPERTAQARALQDYLARHGIAACYGHFRYHVHNFHSGERFRFSSFREERWPPIARDAERAASIALLDNHGKIVEYLADGGGRGAHGQVGSIRIDHDFHPPPAGRTELPPGAIARIRADDGADLTAALRDRDVDTEWVAPFTPNAVRSLDVIFTAPQTVRMVRFAGPEPMGWPRHLAVEVLMPGATAWTPFLPARDFTRLFWSGPRLYYDGVGFRGEIFLPDLEIAGIRLVGSSGGQSLPEFWAISELQCFGPAAEPPGQVEALEALRAALAAEGTRRLYSDRWVANQLVDHPHLDLVLDPRAFPESSLHEAARVRLRPGTGLLTLASDAPASREALRQTEATWTERVVGPWVLMTVRQMPEAAYDGAAWPPLRWVGYGCRVGDRKGYAADLALLAVARRAAGADPHEVRALLAKAVAVSPEGLACADDLIDWVRHALPDAESRALFEEYEDRTTPMFPMRALFDGGRIEFLGVTLAATNGIAGGAIAVDYYWRCRPDAEPHRWAVFVHLAQGRRVGFQDDHRLLQAVPPLTVRRQVCPMMYRERREWQVPADAAPGPYTMRIGLYRAAGRASVKTDLPTRRRAVMTPVTVMITAPP